MKRQNGETGYHRAISRDIGGGAHVVDVRGGSVLRLTCTGGRSGEPHDIEYQMGAHFPPERLNKHMTQKGWRLGKRVACPDCIEKEKTMPSASQPPSDARVAEPPEQPTPSASEAARRATRMIFMALEDYYDDGKKAYRAGHSDKSIAEEFKVSEVYVAKVREDHFGPLAEPSEIAGLRGQLTEVRASIATITTDSAAAVALLTKKADGIEATINRLVTANGWRS